MENFAVLCTIKQTGGIQNLAIKMSNKKCDRFVAMVSLVTIIYILRQIDFGKFGYLKPLVVYECYFTTTVIFYRTLYRKYCVTVTYIVVLCDFGFIYIFEKTTVLYRSLLCTTQVLIVPCISLL